MTTSTPAPQPGPVPPDDLRRELTVAGPDDPGLLHLSVVGDTYTVLLSGDDTGGRFTLIDMSVPQEPPPSLGDPAADEPDGHGGEQHRQREQPSALDPLE